MADLQSPFTLSSYSAHPLPYPDRLAHRLPGSSLSTTPVQQFASPSVQRKSKSPRHSDQVIVTVPGQGWSIHNVSDQAILSSQKVSPSLVFTAPCASLSILKTGASGDVDQPSSSTKKSKKLRTRYIYAPVASCPSHPSAAVNEGRTVWMWVENEVNGGFGERDLSAEPDTCSAHTVKEFSAKVEFVYALPANEGQFSSDFASPLTGRVIVLLQTGQVWLCNETLSTIATCQVHLNPSSGLSSELRFIRVQACTKLAQSGQALLPDKNDREDKFPSKPTSLTICVSRLKPVFDSPSDTSLDNKPPSGRSKKRKSGPTKPSSSSSSTSPAPAYYSQLEINVLEVESDRLHSIGQVSHLEDVLDVAIGAEGWVAIMGRDKTLTTHQISPCPISDTTFAPFNTLALVPHPKCTPLTLAHCNQSTKPESASSVAPLPVLLPLHPSVPLICLLMSHSTQSADSSSPAYLVLCVDLYHRAVLFVLESSWPNLQKHDPLSPTSLDRVPTSLWATLSAPCDPANAYLCLDYNDIRIVQVLPLPQFEAEGPTWVDALGPTVVDATLKWISSKAMSDDAKGAGFLPPSDPASLPSLLARLSESGFHTKTRASDTTGADGVKEFVARFNAQWRATPGLCGQWDAPSSAAAERAWTECIAAKFSVICKNKKKKKKSGPKEAQPNGANAHAPNDESSEKGQGVDGKKGEMEHLPKDEASDREPNNHKLGSVGGSGKLTSVLSKAFVQTLVRMCLAKFTSSPPLALASLSSNGPSAAHRALARQPYPAKIMKALLQLGVVEENMVSGGVLGALRRAEDWPVVGIAVSRLVDISEGHIMDVLRCVIQPESNSAGGDTKPAINGHVGLQSVKSPLRLLLAKIVSQQLSGPSLRKAMRAKLSTEEVFVVLKILNEWLGWWSDEGFGAGGLARNPHLPTASCKDAGDGKNAEASSTELKRSNVPDLDQIFKFIECGLDAHLIGLIQYGPSHGLLGSLKAKLDEHLQTGVWLRMLNGPLAEFGAAGEKKSQEQRRRVKKERSARQERKKKDGTATAKVVKNSKDGKSIRKPKMRGQRGGKAKRAEEGLSRRKAMWESNLAVGEYALERFVL